MKNYITTILSIVSTMFVYSQEGVEVSLTAPVFEIQSGTYKKDINNVLNPYIGTWESIWEGKKFMLQIEKDIKRKIIYESGFYYYTDRLIGKYKIVNLSDGDIIENNLSVTNDNAKIESLARPKDGRFNFIYMDKDYCSNTGDIVLIGNPLNNVLIYKYFYDDYWNPHYCEYTNQNDIPINIPTVDVMLNKL
jgi:hypothetical protein